MSGFRVTSCFAALLAFVTALSPAAFADGDNWLIGTWNTTVQDLNTTYTFTDSSVTVDASGQSMTSDASYDVAGYKITASFADGGSFVCTKTDDTHASCEGGNGSFVLTRQ